MSDFEFGEFLPDKLRKGIEEKNSQEKKEKERIEDIKKKLTPEVMIDTAFFLSNAIFEALKNKKIDGKPLITQEEIDSIIEEYIDTRNESDKNE